MSPLKNWLQFVLGSKTKLAAEVFNRIVVDITTVLQGLVRFLEVFTVLRFLDTVHCARLYFGTIFLIIL